MTGSRRVGPPTEPPVDTQSVRRWRKAAGVSLMLCHHQPRAGFLRTTGLRGGSPGAPFRAWLGTHKSGGQVLSSCTRGEVGALSPERHPLSSAGNGPGEGARPLSAGLVAQGHPGHSTLCLRVAPTAELLSSGREQRPGAPQKAPCSEGPGPPVSNGPGTSHNRTKGRTARDCEKGKRPSLEESSRPKESD